MYSKRTVFLIITILGIITGIGLNFVFDSDTNYDNKSVEYSDLPIDCLIIEDGKITQYLEKGECRGYIIEKVIDGDTIKTMSGDSLRLSLVSAPELDEPGGKESQEFVKSLCPEETPIFVDEDDGQLEGSYGRIIAKVYCGYSEKSVNEVILENNHGIIYKKFCDISEFGKEGWSIRHGCPSLRK